MAGKVATIVNLGLDKPYGEREIVKALRASRVKSDIRLQPIDNGLAYLNVGNKRKAQAETDLLTIVSHYKNFGGIEFDMKDLGDNSPAPEMAGLTNDGVPYIDTPSTPIYLNDPEWCIAHGVAVS